MEQHVLVALPGAFLGGLAAAADIEFLHHEGAGEGILQRKLDGHGLTRNDHLVLAAVIDVAALAVAHQNAVNTLRQENGHGAAAVGFGQPGGTGGDIHEPHDGAFPDGIGMAGGIDSMDRDAHERILVGIAEVAAGGEPEGQQDYENKAFHSLMRQVRP